MARSPASCAGSAEPQRGPANHPTGQAGHKAGLRRSLCLSAIPIRAPGGDQASVAVAPVKVEGMDLRKPLGLVTRKGKWVPPAALALSAELQKTGNLSGNACGTAPEDWHLQGYALANLVMPAGFMRRESERRHEACGYT